MKFEFAHDDLDGALLLISGAAWVAEIRGRDRKYRYERRFCRSVKWWPIIQVVLQDCIGPPIFLQIAEIRPARVAPFWRCDVGASGWSMELIPEKLMRKALAERRQSGPPTTAIFNLRESNTPVILASPRKFHLRENS